MKKTIAENFRRDAGIYAKFDAEECREHIARSRNRNSRDERFHTEEAIRCARKAFRAVMYTWASGLRLAEGR